MNKTTEKALRASIAHWEENVAAPSLDKASVHPHDCALCSMFIVRRCGGCPVAESTGKQCCSGSPYEEAAKAWENNQYSDFIKAAKVELAFLKSLLPQVKP